MALKNELERHELKRLRALVDWYKRDSEERMAYFQRDREQFEQRIAELTAECDRLRKRLRDTDALP